MSEDKIYPTMVIRSQVEAIKLLEKENKQLKEEKKKVWEWVIYKQQHSIEPIISTDELDEILEILGDKENENIK